MRPGAAGSLIHTADKDSQKYDGWKTPIRFAYGFDVICIVFRQPVNVAGVASMHIQADFRVRIKQIIVKISEHEGVQPIERTD